MEEDLILATIPIIPKYEVEEVFGVIYGSSTRTRGAGGRIISGIQALKGGKGTAYAEEIEKARKEALDDLKNEARKLRANGGLSIDFETSEVLEGFILVTAYGTAVKFKKQLENHDESYQDEHIFFVVEYATSLIRDIMSDGV